MPAPLLLSSSSTIAGNSNGSSFRLARSSTQPLQSPRVAHLAGTAVQGAPATPLSSLTRQPSGSDSGSFSEQLTLSVGNDTERIFAMSGVGDDDSAIQSLGEDPTAAAGAGAGAAATPPSSAGLARSNSVRARANMFQQMQQQEQQTRSRREAAGGAGGEQLPQRAQGNRQGECAKLY